MSPPERYGPALPGDNGLTDDCVAFAPAEDEEMSMVRDRNLMMAMALVLAAALLAGCPSLPPRLQVNATSLTIRATSSQASFQISNLGGGTLTWTVSGEAAEGEAEGEGGASWLTFALLGGPASPTATLEGSVDTNVATIRAVVDRTNFQPGTYTAVITVTSGTMQETIDLTVEHEAAEDLVPQLSLSDETVDFGFDATSREVFVSNTGTGVLNWEIEVTEGSDWLGVQPRLGQVSSATEKDKLTLTAERRGLSPGLHTGLITVKSDGGEQTISATINMPIFTVAVTSIDFGRVLTTGQQLLLLRNNDSSGNTTLATELKVEKVGSNTSWLTFPAMDALPDRNNTRSLTIPLTADVSSLAAGPHQIDLVITELGESGYNQTVPVSVLKTALEVDTAPIDFGALTQAQTETIALNNTGTEAVEWEASRPAEAAAWLSITAASGTAAPGNTAAVELTATPERVEPGEYSTQVTISFEGATEVVSVHMTKEHATDLYVEPGSIDFGPSGRDQELLALWNPGIGTVNWSIDTSDFPDWLSLTPEGEVNADGATLSGVVAGQVTDAMTVSVDREQLAESDTVYSYEIQAVGTWAGQEAPLVKSIPIQVSKPLVPHIEITGELADATGKQCVNLAEDEIVSNFTIKNTGGGHLIWRLDLTGKPNWITSIDPLQGDLTANQTQTVRVTVDRSTMNYLGGRFDLPVLSNAGALLPNQALTPEVVQISVNVPKVISIGTKPTGSISFGTNKSFLTMSVANFGDPDTVMHFNIKSSKLWLTVSPGEGLSTGTASVDKDWQFVGLSVDRALLNEKSESAVLTVTATKVSTKSGEVSKIGDATPVEINVSAAAPQLTIEAAAPWLRVPSLTRNVLMLRNLRYQSISLADGILDAILPDFSFTEANQLVEEAETQAFLTPVSRIRANLMILLDYSGSMENAAATAMGAGHTDPLQDLYDQTIPDLIDELPSNYRVAIGVFNEREYLAGAGEGEQSSGPLSRPYINLIQPADGEPAFTSDHAVLKARLNGIQVIDHGATQLTPALEDAAQVVASVDAAQGYIPFDGVELQGIICVTDGRLTTPSLDVTPTATLLSNLRVRAFMVGWGHEINVPPLLTLALASGGHYYGTQGHATGRFDSFGVEIREPVVDDLLAWCKHDPADSCDQSVANDLENQVVLSYITANESTGVVFDTQLTFNDPNDQVEGCLEEQGDITGHIAFSCDFAAIAGDVRLGQVSMNTPGGRAVDGTAEVIVRADYMPRNMSEMTFQFWFTNEDGTADILLDENDVGNAIQIDSNQGGMMPSDRFTVTTTPSGALQNIEGDGTMHRVYTVSAAYIDSVDNLKGPLKYGEFGDLFRFHLKNLLGDFIVHMRVTDPVWNAVDRDVKYFTYPLAMPVKADTTYLAPSFPSTPGFSWASEPEIRRSNPVFALAPGASSVTIQVWNTGGRHDETGVWLHWLAKPKGVTARQGDAIEGIVTDPLDPDNLTVVLDAYALPPGGDWAEVAFDWDFGTANYAGSDSVWIHYTVNPPVLAAAPLALPVAQSGTGSITLSNTGQSYMTFTVDSNTLPAGVTVTPSTGPLADRPVLITVAASDTAALGLFDLTINAVDANNNTLVPQTVAVTVTP